MKKMSSKEPEENNLPTEIFLSNWKPEFYRVKEEDPKVEQIVNFIRKSYDLICTEEGYYNWVDGVFVPLTEKNKVLNSFLTGVIVDELYYSSAFLSPYRFNKIKLLLSYPLTSEKLLNPSGFMNFKNGFLNLETMEFTKHDELGDHLLSTAMIKANYNPKIKKHFEIESFLEQTFKDQLDLIQLFMGNLLASHKECGKLLILQGETHTGKTTFINILYALFGNDLRSNLDIHEFSQKFLPINLRFKWVNIYDELEIRNLTSIKLIKQVVTGVELSSQMKNNPYKVDWSDRTKIIFTTNWFPPLPDRTGEEWYSRLLLCECVNKVNEETKDPELTKKITTEPAKSWFINFMVDGYKNLKKMKWKYPKKYTDITRNQNLWALNSYPLERFFEENYTLTNNKNDMVEVSIILNHYNRFRQKNANRARAVKSNTITSFLTTKHNKHKPKTIQGVRVYPYVKLNSGVVDMDKILVGKSKKEVDKIEQKIIDTFGKEINFGDDN